MMADALSQFKHQEPILEEIDGDNYTDWNTTQSKVAKAVAAVVENVSEQSFRNATKITLNPNKYWLEHHQSMKEVG